MLFSETRQYFRLAAVIRGGGQPSPPQPKPTNQPTNQPNEAMSNSRKLQSLSVVAAYRTAISARAERLLSDVGMTSTSLFGMPLDAAVSAAVIPPCDYLGDGASTALAIIRLDSGALCSLDGLPVGAMDALDRITRLAETALGLTTPTFFVEAVSSAILAVRLI